MQTRPQAIRVQSQVTQPSNIQSQTAQPPVDAQNPPTPITCRIKLVVKVDQSWSIKRIIDEQCPVTWEGLFADARFDIARISNVLLEQDEIGQAYYPLKSDMFNPWRFTPLVKPDGSANVKLVIIGQDPYFNTYVDMFGNIRPQAMGLSFSVNPDCPIPPSLSNMFKELERTIPGYVRPTHGSLVKWAQQGVLMLNIALTVKPGQPGQMLKLSDGLITKTFRAIDAVNPRCVYILMGNEAKAAAQHIGRFSERIESPHPASRPPAKGMSSPFIGSDVFRRANAKLVEQGHTPVDWQT